MSEPKERVYLSGAMRHRPYFQFPQFDYWRDKLIEAGYDVVSPADLDRAEGFDPIARNSENDQLGICDDVQDVRKLLKRDIDALATCHSLALMPDCAGSRGVKAEVAFCEATEMPVRWVEDMCR
jgi:hypothetical protein